MLKVPCDYFVLETWYIGESSGRSFGIESPKVHLDREEEKLEDSPPFPLLVFAKLGSFFLPNTKSVFHGELGETMTPSSSLVIHFPSFLFIPHL